MMPPATWDTEQHLQGNHKGIIGLVDEVGLIVFRTQGLSSTHTGITPV